MKNVWRCTRNTPYAARCPWVSLDARCGYYLEAAGEMDAIAQMGKMFPDDQLGFTAELWVIG